MLAYIFSIATKQQLSGVFKKLGINISYALFYISPEVVL